MDIHDLIRFSAGSSNDENNKHLWVKGAGAYINQHLSLLKYTDYLPNILDVQYFQNSDSESLGQIFTKHGSDKAITHDYHILYSHILQKLGIKNALSILEIGLGTNNPNLVSSMGVDGKPGASLRSWEEFCPNANIFGADIDRDILFETERIKTTFVDQTEPQTFEDLQAKFLTKYDLIIDDGLHSIGANIHTLLFGLHNVKTNGFVVIEDIDRKYYDNWFPIDFMLQQNKMFKTYFVNAKHSYMYVVKKL